MSGMGEESLTQTAHVESGETIWLDAPEPTDVAAEPSLTPDVRQALIEVREELEAINSRLDADTVPEALVRIVEEVARLRAPLARSVADDLDGRLAARLGELVANVLGHPDGGAPVVEELTVFSKHLDETLEQFLRDRSELSAEIGQLVSGLNEGIERSRDETQQVAAELSTVQGQVEALTGMESRLRDALHGLATTHSDALATASREQAQLSSVFTEGLARQASAAAAVADRFDDTVRVLQQIQSAMAEQEGKASESLGRIESAQRDVAAGMASLPDALAERIGQLSELITLAFDRDATDRSAISEHVTRLEGTFSALADQLGRDSSAQREATAAMVAALQSTIAQELSDARTEMQEWASAVKSVVESSLASLQQPQTSLAADISHLTEEVAVIKRRMQLRGRLEQVSLSRESLEEVARVVTERLSPSITEPAEPAQKQRRRRWRRRAETPADREGH